MSGSWAWTGPTCTLMGLFQLFMRLRALLPQCCTHTSCQTAVAGKRWLLLHNHYRACRGRERAAHQGKSVAAVERYHFQPQRRSLQLCRVLSGEQDFERSKAAVEC